MESGALKSWFLVTRPMKRGSGWRTRSVAISRLFQTRILIGLAEAAR